MFDTLGPTTASPRPAEPAAPRRTTAGPLSACLMLMLDEVDYGMVLVSAEAQVLYLNHTARRQLSGRHPLQLMGQTLRACHAQDVAPLFEAMACAQRGIRRLLLLGEGAHRASVSVVPLPLGLCTQPEDASPATLLLLGKHEVCPTLSVQGFARTVGLTPAESRVLERLCLGVSPADIAREQAVAVSTIRTQIGSIRAKTGAGSISALVRQVAVLPPVMGALRAGVQAHGL